MLTEAQQRLVFQRVGVSVIYLEDGITTHNVYAIFNNPLFDSKSDVNMEFERSSMRCLASDLPGLSLTGQFVIAGFTYDIVMIHQNQKGLVMLELEQVI